MLITIEGVDGSGTTTLTQSLKETYPDAIATAEPTTHGSVSQLLRENLSNGHNQPLVDFYLFMADRKEHINKKIAPALRHEQWVICDRYVDSTRAYQPIALTDEQGPFDSVWDAKLFIEQNMKPWIIEPDLTLYLDVSIDTAIERASGDEKYEGREFLKQVKDNYDALVESESFGDDRIVRIDAEQPADVVTEKAIGIINDKIYE